jgi:septal ring factor EnvC (AmiA/AmiB activator)
MKDFETWFAPIALIASTVAALVTIFYGNRSQKREVTFTGVPLDKKEFEKHERDNKAEHERFLARIDALQTRINPIEAEIRALREMSELNNARLAQMDHKIDRLIERTK